MFILHHCQVNGQYHDNTEFPLATFSKMKNQHDGKSCEDHYRWALYCFSIQQFKFLSFLYVLTATKSFESFYIPYTVSAYITFVVYFIVVEAYFHQQLMFLLFFLVCKCLPQCDVSYLSGRVQKKKNYVETTFLVATLVWIPSLSKRHSK